MDLLAAHEKFSVMMYDLRLSEAEMQYLADSLRFLLENVDEDQFYEALTDEDQRRMEPPDETRYVMEDMYRTLMNLIRQYVPFDELPPRFREWVIRPLPYE